MFVNIPTKVEVEAINPIFAGDMPRLSAKRGRVGDLDMVELSIAKKPAIERAINDLLTLELKTLISPSL